MAAVALLVFPVLLAGVSAAPGPADGRNASLTTRQPDQQKLTTVQNRVTNMTSPVTTSKGPTTVKDQEKLTTALPKLTSAQPKLTSAQPKLTSAQPTLTSAQQKLTSAQPPVDSMVVAQRNMMAVPGQTITLPCRAPPSVSIAAVTWTRPDLKGKYVLFFQNGKAVPASQHLLFSNRVDLVDKQTKKGELSLTLKNVKSVDVGTYECRYKDKMENPFSESISTIKLKVPPSGTEDSNRRHSVMAITLSVIGLIVVFAIVTAVVVAIVRKCRRCCRRD